MAWKKAQRNLFRLPAIKKKTRARPRKLEDPIHALCFGWLDANIDGMVFHVPNGIYGGDEVIFIHGKPVQKAAIMWRKMEKLGARAGVCDLTLHWFPGKTAYFEIKSEDGTLSKNQKSFMADLDKFGIPHFIIRSLADCQNAVKRLGIPMKSYSHFATR